MSSHTYADPVQMSMHKALLAVVFAGLSFLSTALSSGDMTATAWVNVAIAVVTAVGVYVVPNTPDQPWAKMVVAILGAALVVLASAVVDGALTAEEGLQIVLAGLSAAGVGTVANEPR